MKDPILKIHPEAYAFNVGRMRNLLEAYPDQTITDLICLKCKSLLGQINQLPLCKECKPSTVIDTITPPETPLSKTFSGFARYIA